MNIGGIRHHEELDYKTLKDRSWQLGYLLEYLCGDGRLLLFDGEEFIKPSDLLEELRDDEFLDLGVRSNEMGIFDFYVDTDRPLYSFALPCPSCGRSVLVPLVRRVKPAEYCGCTGKIRSY